MPLQTNVQVNSWALQRVSRAFALSNQFRPDRWLPSSNDQDSPFANDDKTASQQFSVGPRMCLGKSLAYAEIRLILACIVYNFDIKPVDIPAGRLNWVEQKTYMVVEEQPFEVRLVRVR